MTTVMNSEAKLDGVFRPFTCGSMTLANRTVLAPMSRMFSPGNIPNDETVAYYRRRAENSVGLIVTEGTWINYSGAAHIPDVPNFYGEEALAGWKRVVDAVHAVGGKIAPQIWHTGLSGVDTVDALESIDRLRNTDISHKMSPSVYAAPGIKLKDEMTDAQIRGVIEAYAQAAADAERLGFDAVEIHGAHGYLPDQFLWHETNKRNDRWGGKTLAERTTFVVEMIRACRARVSPDFPIILRMSQLKLQNYAEKLAHPPQELESLLLPISEAGVSIFHGSQRRFWEPEFAGSPLNLAGWMKKITGKPAITVGSVGLETEFLDTLDNGTRHQDKVSLRADQLMERFDRGDFDLIAVGRALLVDHCWVQKIKERRYSEIKPWNLEATATLY